MSEGRPMSDTHSAVRLCEHVVVYVDGGQTVVVTCTECGPLRWDAPPAPSRYWGFGMRAGNFPEPFNHPTNQS